MVKAWYMQDPVQSQFAPNELNPPKPICVDELERRTGLICRQIEVNAERQNAILEAVPEAVAYGYRDTIEVSEKAMGEAFKRQLAIFFSEHLHADDEVRFVLDGTGYFDVRDDTDRWIRIAAEKGDFIVLPAGIYHRFSVDDNKYLKAMRFFAGDPVWTAHYRSQQTDQMPERLGYLRKLHERRHPSG